MLKFLGALTLTAVLAVPAYSEGANLSFDLQGRPSKAKGSGGNSTSTTTPPALRFWMHEDLAGAWADGYLGQGSTITVVDDFSSNYGYYGDLGDGVELYRHGEWTYKESSLVAPLADMKAHDFYSGRTVRLRKGLNVMNLSYGMMAQAGYSVNQIRWGSQEDSLITYATRGDAVVSKAAGNDAVAIGGMTSNGLEDYLATALIGAQSAIFVGALSTNGSIEAPASLASYSNYAGTNPTVQAQFLSVGVEGNETGLYGTSFAAPIVSGYAAVLGSKFTNATPTQITDQLLDTARTDTIRNYEVSIHGQGEASLSRALAPVSIR
jgi:subtilisin family serine protease